MAWLQDSALSGSTGVRLLLGMKYIYAGMRPPTSSQPQRSPASQVPLHQPQHLHELALPLAAAALWPAVQTFISMISTAACSLCQSKQDMVTCWPAQARTSCRGRTAGLTAGARRRFCWCCC